MIKAFKLFICFFVISLSTNGQHIQETPPLLASVSRVAETKQKYHISQRGTNLFSANRSMNRYSALGYLLFDK
jgi:hypothetical protein